MNVLLYPLHSESLVKQTCIYHSVSEDLISSQETKSTKLRRPQTSASIHKLDDKHTHTILYAHAYKAVVIRIDQLAHILATITDPVATTMNPDKDR